MKKKNKKIDMTKLDEKTLIDIDDLNIEINERDELHFDLLKRSIALADSIYSDWQSREEDERKDRKKMIKQIWGGIIVQFVIVIILLIANGINWLEIDEMIFISFFGAIIIQFISLLVIAAKYLYNERTTDCLKIMENLMITTISNNMDYRPELNEVETEA